MSNKSLTLLELNNQIKDCINNCFNTTIWITAEINSINEHRSGHCYLELVQKSANTDRILATTRATIWSSIYRSLKAFFQTATGSKFTSGISVLVKVSVDFHELYGFSLNIRDIDPSYTLGDIARRRQEIINKLKSENVIDINKRIELPNPIQRIAIISSAGAAGYEDFVNQITNNKHFYKYELSLFDSIMQGNETEKSVISAFDSIYQSIEKFDVVVIIRGGGSKTDLAAFDNYNIAFYVTQFPIPVICGIGHERDFSVIDMVSNTSLKTPTAVAEFLIERTSSFEDYLNKSAERMFDYINDKLYINKLFLTQAGLKISRLKNKVNSKIEDCNKYHNKLKHIVINKINERNSHLEFLKNKTKIYSKEQLKSNIKNISTLQTSLKIAIKTRLIYNQSKVDNLENNIRLIDPKNILKRGFTITKFNGKIIKNGTQVNLGDEIETVFYDTKLTSKIIKKDK